MNAYQELPQKRSKIDIIKIKEEINGLSWTIKVLHNGSLVLVNNTGYEENIENFDLYISAIKWLTMSINRKEYTKEEREIINNLIYQYLKLEVLYKKNESSQILESIKLDNELLEYVKDTLKKEIQEIIKSSFADPELITHLERTLEMKNTILDEEVIRSIVRCSNPLLVREINKKLIKISKEKIKFQLSKLKFHFSKIGDYYKNFMTNLWSLRFKQGLLTLNAMWLLLVTSAFLTAGVKIPSILKNGGSIEYKATIESISSLGQTETTEKYLEIDTPSRILEIYSETYESDGLYYKDVETYDISSFETTSDLEKYFSIDLEFLGLEPISTDTVPKGNLNDEEYRVLKDITLDLNDERKFDTKTDKILRGVLEAYWYILLIGVAVKMPFMPLHQFTNVLRKLSELKSKKSDFEERKAIYLEVIEEIEQSLKTNNIELGDIIKMYEETQALARVDSLTPEEINLIKECEDLKGETENMSSSISYKKLKKLLEKNSWINNLTYRTFYGTIMNA